eukprot:TRINITY_DN18110_c0_g1_i1.p1 TRINITY_DN18110_c0_g1~~TRINITY_DN18110_c0_g1_i1.p1  ORF type:complete len:972 (-),score=250.87 TRINITY_DN18110_c0_g1_i1:49-2586(-)
MSETCQDLHLLKCLEVFREPIDFSVEACVPNPVPFADLIKNRIEHHSQFILTEEERKIVYDIQSLVKGYLEEALHVFDAEMVQEQEEEKEQQQEQEQEQEIEIEKYVDLAYSREHEEPTPWPFVTLAQQGDLPQFYLAKEFHLYKREPITFPGYLHISNNYFDKRWSGPRRIKNVVMVLEWVPSRAALAPGDPRNTPLTEKQMASFMTTFNLFDRKTSGRITAGDLPNIVRVSTEHRPTRPEIQTVMSEFGTDQTLSAQQFLRLLQSGRFREEQKNRRFIALSLAEAETIRRVLHVRLEQEVIPQSDTALALRCIPADNWIMDQSFNFEASPAYQKDVSHQSYRFLDCDMYYKDPQIVTLVRSLEDTRDRERRIFFDRVMGCRRRMRRKWEETPVSKVFTTSDQWVLLKQKAMMFRMRETIKTKGLLFYDAFRLFDYNRDGFLSPAELFGAVDWLGLKLEAQDVLEIIRTNDIDGDGNISYKEFLEIVRDPDANFEDIARENETSEEVGRLPSEFEPVQPKALEEILRLQGQIAHEEKLIEEAELKKETAQENEILQKIEDEQRLENMLQEGGPNPKVNQDALSIHYDFATKKRPFGVTSRGDFSTGKIDDESGLVYTLVYKGGMLFLPIPFATEKSPLNEYTIMMDVRFDSFSPDGVPTALIQTAKYNHDTAAIYVRSDGFVGAPGFWPQDANAVRINPKQWHIVSVTANLKEQMMIIYIDGQLVNFMSSEDMIPNGKYAVTDLLCIFGSKNGAESCGGEIRSVSLDCHVRAPFEIQALFDLIQQEGSWMCEGCTYANPRSASSCVACMKKRSVFNVETFWSCPVCTFANTSGNVCVVCETPKP